MAYFATGVCIIESPHCTNKKQTMEFMSSNPPLYQHKSDDGVYIIESPIVPIESRRRSLYHRIPHCTNRKQTMKFISSNPPLYQQKAGDRVYIIESPIVPTEIRRWRVYISSNPPLYHQKADDRVVSTIESPSVPP